MNSWPLAEMNSGAIVSVGEDGEDVFENQIP